MRMRIKLLEWREDIDGRVAAKHAASGSPLRIEKQKYNGWKTEVQRGEDV